jgi:ketosteroid isomerase-like protein
MTVCSLRLFLVAIAFTSAAAAHADVSKGDAAAINKLMDSYVSAWLAGDEAGVMRLLTTDAVLIPNEKAPYVGAAAIRNYWWPAGAPPFKLLRFETTRDQITGSSTFATLRGTQVIEWESGGERWRTSGNYLAVVRKTPAGWRFVIQMAGNGLNERLP